MKRKTEIERKLDILNQTRPRVPMPRPAMFRDKTKYSRKAAKNQLRRELDAR